MYCRNVLLKGSQNYLDDNHTSIHPHLPTNLVYRLFKYCFNNFSNSTNTHFSNSTNTPPAFTTTNNIYKRLSTVRFLPQICHTDGRGGRKRGVPSSGWLGAG